MMLEVGVGQTYLIVETNIEVQNALDTAAYSFQSRFDNGGSIERGCLTVAAGMQLDSQSSTEGTNYVHKHFMLRKLEASKPSLVLWVGSVVMAGR